MDILTALQWRYATKKFDADKKIPEEDFQKILDALILTPSSFGLQPWKFVVVEDPKLREALLPHSWNQAQVVEASHLVVLCRKNTIDEAHVQQHLERISEIQGVELSNLDPLKKMLHGAVLSNSEEVLALSAEKQVYIALGNLLTVAATMGIDSCPMEGFLPEKYAETLGLKEKGLTPVLVCPLGYRSIDDKYASAAKVRFENDDLIERI